MNQDNILLLAKKLKELAERGIGGEKQNAEEKLKTIMRKYKLTPEMLDANLTTERAIECPKEDRLMVIQIISSVIGKNRLTSATQTKKAIGKKHYLFVELNELEYIEIREKIGFYIPKLKTDMELFRLAFIEKNELYNKPDDSSPHKFPTPKEIEEMDKVRKLMYGMEKHQFHKTIENG